MIDLLRTAESRFERIPDDPFGPSYFEVDGLRMHDVDEGPKDAGPPNPRAHRYRPQLRVIFATCWHPRIHRQ